MVAKWFGRIFEPPVQSRWSRNPPNNIKVTSKERSEKLGYKSSLYCTMIEAMLFGVSNVTYSAVFGHCAFKILSAF